MIRRGRAAFGRVADLRECQRRWRGGYSAAIMVARDPPRPLRAVRSAWRTVSEWVSRQLITGNRRGGPLLAAGAGGLRVAARPVSPAGLFAGALLRPGAGAGR